MMNVAGTQPPPFTLMQYTGGTESTPFAAPKTIGKLISKLKTETTTAIVNHI